MQQRDIATLIRFNFWANERILGACDQLAPEAFTREQVPDPGWGSVRAILVHTLDTEYGWRSLLQAHAEDGILNADDFPDVAALQARWSAERAAWFAYVDGLSDTDLNRGYGADPQHGPKVWQTMMHVVTHGIQHRSEVAAILTGYGCSPGDLDFDLFLKEHRERAEH